VLHLNSTITSSGGESTIVLDELKSKHSTSHSATTDAIEPTGSDEAPSDMLLVVFDSINAATILTAALHTTGAAVLSEINAKRWRRLCTTFKTASTDLCQSLALIAKCISTTYVVSHYSWPAD